MTDDLTRPPDPSRVACLLSCRPWLLGRLVRWGLVMVNVDL